LYLVPPLQLQNKTKTPEALGRFEREFATAGFDTAVLPSSSAAYTLGFEAKLVQWRRLASSRTLDVGAYAQRTVRPVAVTRVTPHASRAKC
jgi:hypothetical protein